MTVYSLCVDPERGKYIAFTEDDDQKLTKACSYVSEDEAIGTLLSIMMPLSQPVRLVRLQVAE